MGFLIIPAVGGHNSRGITIVGIAPVSQLAIRICRVEKLVNWLSSSGELEFAMPCQAVAQPTLFSSCHPLLALNRGEILGKHEIFRNGQGAKRRWRIVKGCDRSKDRQHSGGERRGLAYCHLYNPRQKPGHLGSKPVQTATVKTHIKRPKMALLTEGEESCP